MIFLEGVGDIFWPVPCPVAGRDAWAGSYRDWSQELEFQLALGLAVLGSKLLKICRVLVSGLGLQAFLEHGNELLCQAGKLLLHLPLLCLLLSWFVLTQLLQHIQQWVLQLRIRFSITCGFLSPHAIGPWWPQLHLHHLQKGPHLKGSQAGIWGDGCVSICLVHLRFWTRFMRRWQGARKRSVRGVYAIVWPNVYASSWVLCVWCFLQIALLRRRFRPQNVPDVPRLPHKMDIAQKTNTAR